MNKGRSAFFGGFDSGKKKPLVGIVGKGLAVGFNPPSIVMLEGMTQPSFKQLL